MCVGNRSVACACVWGNRRLACLCLCQQEHCVSVFRATGALHVCEQQERCVYVCVCLGQQESCVLELVMCDFTGPILASLWGDLALVFLNKMASTQPPVLMRLTIIRASKLVNHSWNGLSRTSICVLHSVHYFSDRVVFVLARG